MITFTAKLDDLIEDAITKMRILINAKGEDSEHTDDKCLKVTDDDLMFNLENGRYLNEVTEYNLIDNRGYSYNFYVLETEKLMEITDYFIKKYTE